MRPKGGLLLAPDGAVRPLDPAVGLGHTHHVPRAAHAHRDVAGQLGLPDAAVVALDIKHVAGLGDGEGLATILAGGWLRRAMPGAGIIRRSALRIRGSWNRAGSKRRNRQN